MFVAYVSPFTPWCDAIVPDDCSPLNVGNDASKCSVGENTILSETGDASATESSNVPMLDCGSSGNRSVTWSDFVISVHNDGSIEYERMFSTGGTAEGSVGVSEFTIPGELENGKAWQPSN